ncbi:MAG: hypothetical protein UR12_C0006G0005 [candidate division TM6 bacterium GW2011_GWF2_30_66]|nr:MAG: hypothetical protein UR12_C0006G0005 [candidate division TM6 bacterium GW2011_GWF2_30_66]
MKKIYAIEAIGFGFRAFLKNPLFFIITFVMGKIMLIFGLFLAALVSFPYFINLIELGTKIFEQGQEFLINASFKKAIVVVKKFISAFTDIKTIFAEVIESKYLFLFFLIGVILFIACLKIIYDFVIIGWVKLSLAYYDHKKLSIESFFCKPIIYLKYIIATFIFLIISIIPSLIYLWLYLLISYFTIIPDNIAYMTYAISVIFSWYFMLRFWFYPYYIIEGDSSSVEALQKSYNLNLGFTNVIISLFVFIIILGVPGLFVYWYPNNITYAIFGVFLLVSWISSWMSYAFIYRNLVKE